VKVKVPNIHKGATFNKLTVMSFPLFCLDIWKHGPPKKDNQGRKIGTIHFIAASTVLKKFPKGKNIIAIKLMIEADK